MRAKLRLQDKASASAIIFYLLMRDQIRKNFSPQSDLSRTNIGEQALIGLAQISQKRNNLDDRPWFIGFGKHGIDSPGKSGFRIGCQNAVLGQIQKQQGPEKTVKKMIDFYLQPGIQSQPEVAYAFFYLQVKIRKIQARKQ